MAGIIRRAPEGSMIVIFTMLSKTEGGPVLFVVTAGDAAVADRVRCAVRVERRSAAAAGTVDRASLRREEDIMIEPMVLIVIGPELYLLENICDDLI